MKTTRLALAFLALLLAAPPALADVAIIDPSGTPAAKVDPDYSTLRVAIYPETDDCYAVSGVTGTIAAALGANSSVFAMRVDPGTTQHAFITRVSVQYTTIVAYTTPITGGRRLAFFRGSGAAASGGTTLGTAIPPFDSSAPNSQVQISEGGDARISTTGALTVTGITYEAQELSTMGLVHVGAAGGHQQFIWEWNAAVNSHPLQLQPGQLLAVRNPVAMDAAGTWTLAVTVEWCERAP